MITKEVLQEEITALLDKELNWSNIKQLNELYRLLGYIYASEKMKDEFTGTEVYTIEEGNTDHVLTKTDALKWVSNMENEDGSVGQHWSMDETRTVMKNHDYNLDATEFYVVMNMLFSDFGKTLMGIGIIPTNTDAYARLAKAWLTDEDAVPDKLYQYKLNIVQ